MALILSPFERLVLRALWTIICIHLGIENRFSAIELTDEIDLAIRTSDGQQRAAEANKDLVP